MSELFDKACDIVPSRVIWLFIAFDSHVLRLGSIQSK